MSTAINVPSHVKARALAHITASARHGCCGYLPEVKSTAALIGFSKLLTKKERPSEQGMGWEFLV